MKKILLVLIVLLNSICNAQTIDWYYTADTVTMAGWPALDVNIPAGMRIDSVYGGFQRSGVTVASEDWACDFEATSPWNYNDSNTTLYNHWIDLTSFNFVGPGVFRAAIPNGANPATWDSLGIATSSVVGISVMEKDDKVLVYPNPVSQLLHIKITGKHNFQVFDVLGNIVMSGNLTNQDTFDVSYLKVGMYYLKVEGLWESKFIKN